LKVLAIGAHPDDIELGCGASLKLLKEKGCKVYMLVLSRGEASGDPEVRERECAQSAETLCVDKLFFGYLQDTRISDGFETIAQIEKVLKETKANLVFTHDFKDGHQDHRNASRATISAARNVDKVLLYESPSAFRDFFPQVFVDVTSTFDTKMKALEAFGSQAKKVYFKGNRRNMTVNENRHFPFVANAIEGLARYRGFQAGVTLAEAFEASKFVWSIEQNHPL
jgi:LmbE family N-acetylglucosaminyl deacetylase